VDTVRDDSELGDLAGDESPPAFHNNGKFAKMVSLMAADDIPGTNIPALDSPVPPPTMPTATTNGAGSRADTIRSLTF